MNNVKKSVTTNFAKLFLAVSLAIDIYIIFPGEYFIIALLEVVALFFAIIVVFRNIKIMSRTFLFAHLILFIFHYDGYVLIHSYYNVSDLYFLSLLMSYCSCILVSNKKIKAKNIRKHRFGDKYSRNESEHSKAMRGTPNGFYRTCNPMARVIIRNRNKKN